MKNKIKLLAIIFSIALYPVNLFAKTYDLTIDYKKVEIDGKKAKKFAVNDSIPAPTLYFEEGEDVEINVTNNLKEDTAIHWHGLILPGEMDGVPGFNGFDGIKPKQTFTYKFKIKQSGTYWYHSHSMGQEQDGIYGAIVIKPKKPDVVKVDRDYVILLSDYSKENANQILNNLKSDSEYYQKNRPTIIEFFSNIKNKGFDKTISSLNDWGKMAMLPSDIADVSYEHYLVNGKTIKDNWTALFKPNEKIRLRFINGSAMSFFDVRIDGLKMKVIAADGQNVEPVEVDEFRFGVAEIYDVIVEPKEAKTYSIIAEPINRDGFALATLTYQEGLRADIPKQRPHLRLTMTDMNMDNHVHHEGMEMAESGWSKTGANPNSRMLDYSDLRYLYKQKDVRKPTRNINVVLDGNMNRYIWNMKIDDKDFSVGNPIYFNHNERVKITFTNNTMMAHPMHLHGLFFQLDNGQPMDKLPNKNVVVVPPGKTYSIIVSASEIGQWALHCHLLYHMLTGMMAKVEIKDDKGNSKGPLINNEAKEVNHEKHSH